MTSARGPVTTSHRLRHATATLLLDHGVELVTVKELLGHARTGVTVGVYTSDSASNAKSLTPRLRLWSSDGRPAARTGSTG